MKIMVCGLPGSGKTTQAQKLSQYFKIPFFSMGDLLRKAAQDNTLLGEEVKQAVQSGELVEDKLTAQILKAAVQKNGNQGFIIDGFPRDIEQLDYFDPEYDYVFYINIASQTGKDRLFRRHRHDDIPEVIAHRFEVQQNKLTPLLKHLEGRYRFIEIDGEKTIEEINQTIMEKIDI